MNIHHLTALELGSLIKAKQLSAPEVARAFLDASAADNATLNAYTEILEESAMAAATAVQKRLDAGESLSPLAGVPMALKDNICSTEGTTTAASKMLGGYRSPFDAAAVEKLKAAGAVIIGKTNMDEFAMGSSTEKSYYGPTRNPWGKNRVPGGSSGGSAAAVAAGLAPYALGTDTGGSVRQPCGFCNLTGVKPTYGSVSRHGLISYASSLDQIGPMARDAADCAAILSILASLAVDTPHPPTDAPRPPLKIAMPTNHYDLPGLAPAVRAQVLKTADTLRSLGAEIVETTIPLLECTVPTYLIIACAEASSNMARYDGVKYGYRALETPTINDVFCKTRAEGFGAEAKRRILFGTFVLLSENYDTWYRKAVQTREMIKAAYDEALKACDLILTPVSPTPAYEIGANIEDPLEMYLGDIYTASANLAGLPAAAAPCGFDGDGMPIGMQLIGRPYSESLILDTLASYQEATDFHKKRPPSPDSMERGAAK
ncbi:MAG: Asp-tRNA(Asn)/Glu-tRNA(Gln) amidotransferase subunit GatA [Clostridiales bacterium]|nr:Asp-tRNA(Asn)/Glu-tRNA(Gln) amidotransferase subunit GatA [Clostridiales bacterium]